MLEKDLKKTKQMYKDYPYKNFGNEEENTYLINSKLQPFVQNKGVRGQDGNLLSVHLWD